MTLPELQAWCWHGSGRYYLPRLRVGWQIEAAAERQALQRAREPAVFGQPGTIRWLGGGPCDPHDSCYFEDEQGVA